MGGGGTSLAARDGDAVAVVVNASIGSASNGARSPSRRRIRSLLGMVLSLVGSSFRRRTPVSVAGGSLRSPELRVRRAASARLAVPRKWRRGTAQVLDFACRRRLTPVGEAPDPTCPW